MFPILVFSKDRFLSLKGSEILEPTSLSHPAQHCSSYLIPWHPKLSRILLFSLLLLRSFYNSPFPLEMREIVWFPLLSQVNPFIASRIQPSWWCGKQKDLTPIHSSQIHLYMCIFKTNRCDEALYYGSRIVTSPFASFKYWLNSSTGTSA